MKRNLIVFALCLVTAFLVLSVAGCQKEKSSDAPVSIPKDKVAAEVNGIKIYEIDVQGAVEGKLQEHSSQGNQIDRQKMRDVILDEHISEALILSEAIAAGVTVTDEELNATIDDIKARFGEENFNNSLKAQGVPIEKYRELVKNRMLKDKFVTEQMMPKDVVKEADIKKFYKESTVPFMKPASVMVKFLQTSSEADAKAIAEELGKLTSQTKREQHAEQLYKDKKAFVSQYGWTDPNMFSAEIAGAMKEIKEGSIGGPYKGSDGYYIIFVKERSKERPKKYEEAKEEIRQLLYEQARNAAVAHWVAEKLKTANVVKY